MMTLLALPSDVLLHIRDGLSSVTSDAGDPSLSLSTHIALSRTCRRLRSLYDFGCDEAEDAFWQAACSSAGFGRPLRRESADSPQVDELPSWRQLALLVVAHHDLCEIRSCKDASAWLGPHSCSGESTPAEPLAFHPLFYYLHFCPRTHAPDAASILLTQLPTVPGGRLQAYAPLAGHSRAACAFATSPPVRTISLVRQGDSEELVASVANPDGVTLLDVNRLLADTLPRNGENMNIVMAHYHTLLEAYARPDCSFVQTLSEGAHRGFLRDHSYPYLNDNAPLPPAEDIPPAKSASADTLFEFRVSTPRRRKQRRSSRSRSRSRAGFFIYDDAPESE